jgi:site-specific DNA recombinase
MSKKKRACTYARVSLDVQAEEGRSLSAQKAEMREFAETRGWKVVAEFVDAGETGRNTDRPGLQAALEAAEEGEFDVLLVHELSRLSRSVTDTIGTFEKLGEMGVGFASVKEPDFDFASATGRLFLAIMAALNQHYVDLITMHTAKSKRDRARRGLYNASIAPYGYKHVGDANTPPEIVEEEAKVVRGLFERYATGEHSSLDLVKWVNEAGYRTRSRNRFAQGVVAQMLRNPFYKGKVVYRQGKRVQGAGEIYDGQHEAIVNEELWETVREVREQRRNAPMNPKFEEHLYLLNGIVNCDICERNLQAQWKDSRGYYIEVSNQRGFLDCPDAGLSTRAEEIDRQIGAIFRWVRLPDDWREELAEMAEQQEEERKKEKGPSVEECRARLVAKRRRLKMMFIKGFFDDDEEAFDQKLAQVRQELAALPELEKVEEVDQATLVIEELLEIWDEAEKVERRDLLRLAVQKIAVDVPQSRLVSIEPYHWFAPLFRKVPLLWEIESGVFSPVWPETLIEELDVMPMADVVKQLPDAAEALDWPLVIDLPEYMKGQRVTPLLSDCLKDRRRAGKALEPVVALENPRTLPLKVHGRYWSVQIERVNSLSRRPDGSAAFLWTPFALQREKDKEEVIARAQRVTEEEGLWVVVDVLPSSMGSHWLYRYFPDAWEIDRNMTWNAYELYNLLREVGFEVEVERKSLYQPVAVGVALEMVKERKLCPQLALLLDSAYEEGVQRLESAAKREGKGHKLSSEVCLVIVRAEKQSSGKVLMSE